MANTSTEQTILEDLRDILRGTAAITINAQDIKVRELPKATEELDALPEIIICSGGPTKTVPLSFEQAQVDRIYSVQVAIVIGTEGDFATNQDLYQGWHEAAQRAIRQDPITGDFRDVLPTATSVFGIDFDDAATFDRSLLNKNYAYMGIMLRIHSNESG